LNYSKLGYFTTTNYHGLQYDYFTMFYFAMFGYIQIICLKNILNIYKKKVILIKLYETMTLHSILSDRFE